MKNKTSPSNIGAVVSVRGSVVDIRFEDHLPPIYSLLRAGQEGRVAIEVLAQLDARLVRGIALTPTQGLARGMVVETSSSSARSAGCSAMPSTVNRHRQIYNAVASIEPRRR